MWVDDGYILILTSKIDIWLPFCVHSDPCDSVFYIFDTTTVPATSKPTKSFSLCLVHVCLSVMQSAIHQSPFTGSNWSSISSLGGGFTASSVASLASLSSLPASWMSQWDPLYWQKWHQKHWTLCFWFAAFYVIAVRLGIYLMSNRKPFDLRIPLAIWSGCLGIFSIIGTCYMLPELISVLRNDGFHAAACENSFAKNNALLFWSWLFVWSKIVEFGDTLFIILRKQNLSFLHWYHHAMTVICVFSYFPNMVAINRWTGSMNYLVHSIMYSYYALRALRIRLPRPIAVSITTMQIAQMIIGFYVAIYELQMKLMNKPCKITLPQSIFSFSVYFSYFILFVNFFLQTYFLKKPSKVTSSLVSPSKILETRAKTE